jgi:hypothetical protein
MVWASVGQVVGGLAVVYNVASSANRAVLLSAIVALLDNLTMEVRNMKHVHPSVWWLIFGPIAVLILLPILNLLFHIEEAMHPVLPPVILFVCFSLMFAGVFLAFAGVLRVGKERTTILRAGVPAKARILSTEMGDAKMTIGGADERWLVILELEVQPQDGPPFEACAEHFVPLLDVPKFQAGEVVEVRYDPQDKTRVAIT